MGDAPVLLSILDVMTHLWYRTVGRAVERALPKMRSIGEGGITLGYSCTDEYSFPLINLSSSAGQSLQGFLTDGDLLVYHIVARLARDVRTRIILDEPIAAIRLSPEYIQTAHSRPTVIPDSQGDSQNLDHNDDEQKPKDAADLPSSPPPLPLPDLPKSVC